MEKFAEDLSKILDSTEEDNLYEVLEVLKDGDCSRVEKVRKDGSVYVRKYYQEEQYTIHDLSRLTHAALPLMYGSYQLADKIALIEEYIEGVTLHDYVKQNKELSLKEAVTLTLELCEVVSYLHGQNPPIIHRDIKPSNIMRTSSGIKLIDFNIARSYSPGKERDTVYMGTVGYAPPEQFGFGQTDMRSDIFSIGKTFLYMLTGSQPQRHIDTATLGTLPDSVQRIIYLSTNFTPQFRYNSVDDMIKDLRSTGDTVISYDGRAQDPDPSCIVSNAPIQSSPDQQNPSQTDIAEAQGTRTERDTLSGILNTYPGAFSLPTANETDLLCSRALPPERPEHDGSFLNKEDRQEDVPKITAEENNLDTVPRFLPGETTLSSSPVQPSEKGQVKPLKAQMKQRKLVLLLTAACCVVLTVGLGVFFMLNDQGPANALAGATAQAPEPDPEPEFGSKLELESEPESEPETGSGEDPASNPETESGSNPETNTKPKSEVNTRPEDNPTPALTAPTIEIISAKPDKSTVFTGASKTQYDIYNRPYPYIESPDPVIYTIKTNVPAARLEIQNKDTYLATLATYFVNSDGTFNAEPPSANYIGTREISSDKMTWKIGKFSWNYPCIVTVTITAYDSDGKKSAPKSFTVSVQQRYL